MADQFKNPEPETKVQEYFRILVCPSCGEAIQIRFPAADDHQGVDGLILSGLPAGVKFDPTDQELVEHLEAKVLSESGRPDHSKFVHPMIDKFIPTLETPGGICYTHPHNLPGVSTDGQPRHFFHRPSNAYTIGSRKRRRVEGNDHEDMRWHKTGKTRPIFSPPFAGSAAAVKGFKKILVLYTNYGRKRKPRKTNWVMHQYHIGGTQEEEQGQLVLSKVLYRKPPGKQTGSTGIGSSDLGHLSDGQYSHHQFYGKQPAGFYCYGDELGKISDDQVGTVPYFGGDQGQGQGSDIASGTSKAN